MCLRRLCSDLVYSVLGLALPWIRLLRWRDYRELVFFIFLPQTRLYPFLAAAFRGRFRLRYSGGGGGGSTTGTASRRPASSLRRKFVACADTRLCLISSQSLQESAEIHTMTSCGSRNASTFVYSYARADV